MAQELGARWKQLPDEEKKYYESLAVGDKARYEVVSDLLSDRLIFLLIIVVYS